MTEQDFPDMPPTFIGDGDTQELDAQAVTPEWPMKTESTLQLGGRGLFAVSIEHSRPLLPSVDRVPSLLDRLSGPDSLHRHKYNEEDSVFYLSCEAEDTPAAERTDAQNELLADLEVLSDFAFATLDMQYVYTPAELHDLVTKLQRLRQKNRPDFNEVEGDLINFVLRHKSVVDKKTVAGIVKREEAGEENRRGMQWSTLTTVANAANSIMVPRFQNGPELRKYAVYIDKDPDLTYGDKKAVNLQAVYQFVALTHAYAVVGARNSEITPTREETFCKNAEVIEAWYEEVKPVLSELPTETNWLRDERARRFPHACAKLEIEFLLQVLADRRDGNEKSGVRKSYTQDPVGAINAQLRLGHIIETIRRKLEVGADATQEDIVPLDIDAMLQG